MVRNFEFCFPFLIADLHDTLAAGSSYAFHPTFASWVSVAISNKRYLKLVDPKLATSTFMDDAFP